MVYSEKELVAKFEGSNLQDVEVPCIVLPKSVLAPSEAEVGQHAVAEDVSGIALARGAPAACYELFRSLPPTATPCRQQTVQGSGFRLKRMEEWQDKLRIQASPLALLYVLLSIVVLSRLFCNMGC